MACVEYYQNSAVDMPQRHYLNRFVRDFRQWTEKYVDFMHYTVPLTCATADNYTFPSEYIGLYGVYDTVRHIYDKSAHLRHLIRDNSILTNNRYFASELEKGIDGIRSNFRERHQLNDDQTVIFFAPGNERREAEFTTEAVRRGVKEFLLKYSAPTSLSAKARPLANFVTVISLHSGSEGEKYVREYLKEN